MAEIPTDWREQGLSAQLEMDVIFGCADSPWDI